MATRIEVGEGMKYFSMFSGIGGFERGIEQAWNVLNVKNPEPYTRVEKNAVNVCANITRSGEKRTATKLTRMLEDATKNGELRSLRRTVENATVAENQHQSSLQSTTLKTTGQMNGAELEEEEYITQSLKVDSQIDTNCSATTAILQRDSTANAPICVGYSEIDRFAIQTYERHFKHDNYGDATNINAKELPDFDLLVGGFPCQAFSIAGKRAGFNDTRGTLFFDIARILAEKRPRHLVLENVKGLLSHDTGKTFQTILGVLADLGYRVEWQVLNSKDFGVPQNRERVYFVGHLRGECSGEILPIGQDGRTTDSGLEKGVQQIANTLRARDYASWRGNHIKQVGNIHQHKRDRDNPSTGRVYSVDGISPTLPTMQGGGLEPKIVQPVLTPDRLVKRQNGRRFKNDGEPSFTLNTQDRHGLYDGARIRRLTPVECERLQGFPDGWTDGVSDTQRYKQCGNAVTVNTVQAVMERLFNHV